MHRISGRIIRPLFKSGIRPDTGFDLPDIWLDTGTKNSRIYGIVE
jgi:hypothetical protein